MSQPTYGYVSGIPYVLPGQRFEGTQFTPALAAAIAARVGQLQDIEVLPDGRLRFTLPNGDQLTTDEPAQGPAGPANNLSVGTVQTGPLGVTITGTAPDQTLNLTVPAGTLQPGDAPRLPIDMSGGNISTGSSLTTPGIYTNAQPTGLPDNVASIRGTFIKLAASAALFFSDEGEVLSWGYDDDAGEMVWTPLGADPELAADLAALTGRVGTAEGDIDALEGRATTAESDIDALEGRATTIEGTVSGHGSRLTTAETNITALQSVPPQLVGTGQPNGRVTAVPGATYVDTARTAGALTWVKATGTGTSGWEPLNADTGWVALVSWSSGAAPITGTPGQPVTAGTITPNGAGGVHIRRSNGQVWVRVSGGNFANARVTLPEWTRPFRRQRSVVLASGPSIDIETTWVQINGDAPAYWDHVATFPTTGAWPTSL